MTPTSGVQELSAENKALRELLTAVARTQAAFQLPPELRKAVIAKSEDAELAQYPAMTPKTMLQQEIDRLRSLIRRWVDMKLLPETSMLTLESRDALKLKP